MVTAAHTLISRLDDLVPRHLELYEDLHRHPELSHQEHRTAGIVADRLRLMPQSRRSTAVVNATGDGAAT